MSSGVRSEHRVYVAGRYRIIESYLDLRDDHITLRIDGPTDLPLGGLLNLLSRIPLQIPLKEFDNRGRITVVVTDLPNLRKTRAGISTTSSCDDVEE